MENIIIKNHLLKEKNRLSATCADPLNHSTLEIVFVSCRDKIRHLLLNISKGLLSLSNETSKLEQVIAVID